ncbi:UNVERIFIED_CONTAM: hypothetical protein Slati_2733600 [Sesamum latifolium]|uniref:Uncharacterized protein n=1 Tax=Sesamum latifolium TaxID=2727402 RepID=A0AAW2VXD1_9LAMI
MKARQIFDPKDPYTCPHVASHSPHVASHQRRGQQPPWTTSALVGGHLLTDKTPCSSKLLEQKDSLLTKESSMMKVLPDSEISSNNIPNNLPENRGNLQTPSGRGHPPIL